MTEPEFTPGPWVAEVERWGVRDPQLKPGDIMAGKTHVVCFGHGYDEYGNIDSLADAFLIAAAPDLYAALESLLEEVKYQRSMGNFSAVRSRKELARAALAKARGETSSPDPAPLPLVEKG